METITKRDKWRSLLLWWSQWTLFTINNAVQACRRSGAGVVVAIVKSELVSCLASIWWWYKIVGYDYEKSHIQDLINKSQAVWLWLWLEDNFDDEKIKFFYVNLINNLPNISVIDADLILFIKKNKEHIKFRASHILTMNIKETDLYFDSKDPDIESVQNEAKELWCWIVLKWWKTKICSPSWEVCEINTSNVPEMTNAGMWDVLTWIITGLLSQWYEPIDAIKTAILIRESAAKHYLSQTNDIIVLPEDVIRNISFVVKKVFNSIKSCT